MLEEELIELPPMQISFVSPDDEIATLSQLG